MVKKKGLKGIFAPIPTPFDNDGVKGEKIKELVTYLIENGVDGIYALGTTGEFFLMTEEEKIHTVSEVVYSANSRVPVVANVSDTAPLNSIRLSKKMKDLGVDAVACTPPYYYKTGNKGLYTYFRTISESIEIPLIVYNIPEWTNSFVPAEVISKLADKGLIAGMKYTEYNLLRLIQFIELTNGSIDILTGSDAMILDCLIAGGSGAVVSVSNVLPKEVSSIYDNFIAGRVDEARKTQSELTKVVFAVSLGEFPSGLKEAMRLLGHDFGKAREPIQPLSKREKQMLRGLLERWLKRAT